MTLKRFYMLLVLGLFIYLGLYTWNERTGYLNALAENTGLEIIGHVLSPANWLITGTSNIWSKYIDLVNVREDRDILQERLSNATVLIASMQKDKYELVRLRELMHFSTPKNWTLIGARVIGTRVGPQAVLNSLMLDKGFTSGATPGTPAVTTQGVIGQILRSSPNFSTVLLVNDPSCRIAIISQETRFQGIISGNGPGKPLDVHYVPPNAQVRIGEYLLTSGLDGLFPKGIPVAWVQSAKPSDTSPFQAITAWPIVHLNELEEVLLLQPAAGRKENPFNRFLDDFPMPPPSPITSDSALPWRAPPQKAGSDTEPSTITTGTETDNPEITPARPNPAE